MTRGVALLGLCATLACSEEIRLDLALPAPSAEDRSVFVVVESENARSITAGVAGESFGPLRVRRENGELSAISVLYFRETLEELELSPGEVSEIGPTGCGRFPLRSARRIFRQRQEDAAFTEVAEIPASLADAHLRVSCPCVQLRTISELDLPDRSPVHYQTKIAGDRGLIVTATHYLLVDEQLALVDTASTATMTASAFVDDAGVLWMAGGNGRIYRGDNYRKLARFAEAPNEELFWVDGGPLPGGGGEMYFLSYAGPVFRVGNDGITTISRERSTRDGHQEGSVAWLSPGRALVLQEDDFGVLEIDTSRTPPVAREPWELGKGVPAAIDVASGEIYLSTLTGLVFQRRGKEWIEVPQPGTPEGVIRKFISYKGGFFGIGNYGYAVQYHPHAGFCEHVVIGGGLDFLFATELGDNILLTGRIANPFDEPDLPQTAYLLGPE